MRRSHCRRCRRPLALAVVIAASIAVASPAHAMTWAAKYIESPASSGANSTSKCAFAYGAAGYLNASKFDGSSCMSNPTQSTWDSDLSNDTFAMTNSGIVYSVRTSTAWRNQFSTRSYTVYNATKCAGSTLSLPAASGTIFSTSFDDRSVAASGWSSSCQA